MSSVSRFLRQRIVGNTLAPYTAGELVYVLIPGAGNYVGNYPNSPFGASPGYVVQQSIQNLSGAVYRDMGKTIYCAVGSNGTSGPSAQSTPGFFREVQIITPSLVANPLAVTTFGVGGSGANNAAGTGLPGALPAGGNTGDAGYSTFYIPIVVNGIVASGTTGVALTPSIAGYKLSEQL